MDKGKITIEILFLVLIAYYVFYQIYLIAGTISLQKYYNDINDNYIEMSNQIQDLGSIIHSITNNGEFNAALSISADRYSNFFQETRIPVIKSQEKYIKQKYKEGSFGNFIQVISDKEISTIQSYLRVQYQSSLLKDLSMENINYKFYQNQQTSENALNNNIGILLPIGSILYFQFPLDSTKNTGIIHGKYILRFCGYRGDVNQPFDFYEYVLCQDIDLVGFTLDYYFKKEDGQMKSSTPWQVHEYSGINYNWEDIDFSKQLYNSLNVSYTQENIPKHFHYSNDVLKAITDENLTDIKYNYLGYNYIVTERLMNGLDDQYNFSQYKADTETDFQIPIYVNSVGKYLTRNYKDSVNNCGYPNIFHDDTQSDHGNLAIMPYYDGYTWGGQYHNYLKVYQYIDDNNNYRVYQLPSVDIDKDTYEIVESGGDHEIGKNTLNDSGSKVFDHISEGKLSDTYFVGCSTEHYQYYIYDVDFNRGIWPKDGYLDEGNFVQFYNGIFDYQNYNYVEWKDKDHWRWFNVKDGKGSSTKSKNNGVSDYGNGVGKYIYAKGQLDNGTMSYQLDSTTGGINYQPEIINYQYPEKQITNFSIDMQHGHQQIMEYTFVNDTGRKFLYMYVVEDYVANYKSMDQNKFVFW